MNSTGLPYPPPISLLTQLPIAGVITATVVKVPEAAVSSQSVHDASRTDGVYERCLPVSWQGPETGWVRGRSRSPKKYQPCHLPFIQSLSSSPRSTLFPHLYNVPYSLQGLLQPWPQPFPSPLPSFQVIHFVSRWLDFCWHIWLQRISMGKSLRKRWIWRPGYQEPIPLPPGTLRSKRHAPPRSERTSDCQLFYLLAWPLSLLQGNLVSKSVPICLYLAAEPAEGRGWEEWRIMILPTSWCYLCCEEAISQLMRCTCWTVRV